MRHDPAAGVCGARDRVPVDVAPGPPRRDKRDDCRPAGPPLGPVRQPAVGNSGPFRPSRAQVTTARLARPTAGPRQLYSGCGSANAEWNTPGSAAQSASANGRIATADRCFHSAPAGAAGGADHPPSRSRTLHVRGRGASRTCPSQYSFLCVAGRGSRRHGRNGSGYFT